LSVRLQPAGAVTGRVLDKDGKPAAGVTIAGPSVATVPEDLTDGSVGLPELYYRTDKDGKFRIDCLAPGVKYGIVLAATRGELASGITVKSGETKDLGDLTDRK
jgi:Carboxypeptidase regulatory-like domain